MLLYVVVRVIPVKSGHGHFGQNQNKKIISRLKIVYINNILFIYTIFRTFFPSENEFDRNDHDRIWPDFVVTKELHYFINHKKIVVYVFHIYTATYSTASCPFLPVLLNKSSRIWTNSRKMYYLCTVNQWKCSGSLAGGIYYDQGRSQ